MDKDMKNEAGFLFSEPGLCINIYHCIALVIPISKMVPWWGLNQAHNDWLTNGSVSHEQRVNIALNADVSRVPLKIS